MESLFTQSNLVCERDLRAIDKGNVRHAKCAVQSTFLKDDQ